MKKIGLMVALLTGMISAGHAATPTQDDAAQAQVRQVIERFQAAIVARDKATLESLFVPEGGAWFEVLGEDAWQRLKGRHPGMARFHPDSFRHFAEFVAGSPQRMQEQFSNVRIHTDGAVAAVYFDFVFLADGKRTNTGSETWQLIHTGDGWKISAMAYSSYPPPSPLK